MKNKFIFYKGFNHSDNDLIENLKTFKDKDDTLDYISADTLDAPDNFFMGRVRNKDCEKYSWPKNIDDIISLGNYDLKELGDMLENEMQKSDNTCLKGIIYNEIGEIDPLRDNDELKESLSYNSENIFYRLLISNYNHNNLDNINMTYSIIMYKLLDEKVIARANNETLYYYFKDNEIMISNNLELIKKYYDDVKELKNQTLTYSFDKINITNNKKNEQVITNDKTINDIFKKINKFLVEITDESVRKELEKNITEYLSSNESKKKLEDYLSKELDIITQKEILKKIRESLINNNEEIENNIKDKIDEKLEEYMSKKNLPMVNVIKLNNKILGKTNGEYYHKKFKQILEEVELDEPVMLIGPAGSGKNYTIEQVSNALGKHMYYTNNASNEFKLTGFIDAGGTYRETEFYKAYKNGGIFFLDELDASDPNALIVINSAIANGYMTFPNEIVEKNKDFRMLAAANTWGAGADLEYIGRNALDAATLDRFDNIFFDYDTTLEKNLYPNDTVLNFMWSFRNAIYKSKILHIVSTRGIGKVYKKEINGFPVDITLESNIVKNLDQDDINVIIENMENIDDNNKYFDGLKKLELKR